MEEEHVLEIAAGKQRYRGHLERPATQSCSRQQPCNHKRGDLILESGVAGKGLKFAGWLRYRPYDAAETIHDEDVVLVPADSESVRR